MQPSCKSGELLYNDTDWQVSCLFSPLNDFSLVNIYMKHTFFSYCTLWCESILSTSSFFHILECLANLLTTTNISVYINTCDHHFLTSSFNCLEFYPSEIFPLNFPAIDKNSMVRQKNPKNKKTDMKTSGIEDPDMNPCGHTYLIFYKDTKNIWWRKDSLFNTVAGKTGFSCRKLKLHLYLSPYTSIYSKWIKELNVRPETLKLGQKRAGSTLEAIGIGNDFFNRNHKAQDLR
jgi:hypothetical protein